MKQIAASSPFLAADLIKPGLDRLTRHPPFPPLFPFSGSGGRQTPVVFMRFVLRYAEARIGK